MNNAETHEMFVAARARAQTRENTPPGVTSYMTTRNGAPIVAAKPVLRGWIVIADLSDHNDIHPYVTWWMDVDGHTFHGDYYETFAEAYKSWEERS